MKKALLTLLMIITIIITTGCHDTVKEKPVIYLYPTEVTDVEKESSLVHIQIIMMDGV